MIEYSCSIQSEVPHAMAIFSCICQCSRQRRYFQRLLNANQCSSQTTVCTWRHFGYLVLQFRCGWCHMNRQDQALEHKLLDLVCLPKEPSWTIWEIYELGLDGRLLGWRGHRRDSGSWRWSGFDQTTPGGWWTGFSIHIFTNYVGRQADTLTFWWVVCDWPLVVTWHIGVQAQQSKQIVNLHHLRTFVNRNVIQMEPKNSLDFFNVGYYTWFTVKLRGSSAHQSRRWNTRYVLLWNRCGSF